MGEERKFGSEKGGNCEEKVDWMKKFGWSW
jgi:hypothetical protein